jgi:AcrR family transcriptional regulator
VRDVRDQRILDAVLDLVAEGGAHELSMARVAERSGVPVRTIYYRFEKRSELLSRAIDQLARELESVASHTTGEGSARELLHDQVTSLFDAYRAQQHRLAIFQYAAGDPELARHSWNAMRWHREMLRLPLDAASAEGTLRLPLGEAVAIASSATAVPSWRALTLGYGLDEEAALLATVTSLDGALFG